MKVQLFYEGLEILPEITYCTIWNLVTWLNNGSTSFEITLLGSIFFNVLKK